jgi:hypothetical protein
MKLKSIVRKTHDQGWALKCMVCQNKQATIAAELSEHPGFCPVVCGACSGLDETEIFNRAFRTEVSE